MYLLSTVYDKYHDRVNLPSRELQNKCVLYIDVLQIVTNCSLNIFLHNLSCLCTCMYLDDTDPGIQASLIAKKSPLLNAFGNVHKTLRVRLLGSTEALDSKCLPSCWYSLCKKVTIHQVITMLATSKNVLFPGNNHLLTTTGTRAIIKVSDHQYWWLAGGYDLEIGHFWK